MGVPAPFYAHSSSMGIDGEYRPIGYTLGVMKAYAMS